MKRFIITTMLLMSMSLLGGCHDNPLKALTKKQQINFLMQASRSAEQVMGLFSEPGGGYYLSCMSGEDIELNCQKLFEHMLDFAHLHKEFSRLTLSQLTDARVFAEIALEYQDTFFNTI
ncbi:hypothetical protein [Legionella bozemanae]|uniref:LvrD n=1 Tax=Legionella bozemanae TaxID=447 RepID=A0A0W0RY85_LEGBO|nr:hypothetical protein [Legionella bozemanae]KTC75885.1 LvrD [Legionella bozemanae]STO35490.1 Uncharacterised protein [Legionella bozemanae]